MPTRFVSCLTSLSPRQPRLAALTHGPTRGKCATILAESVKRQFGKLSWKSVSLLPAAVPCMPQLLQARVLAAPKPCRHRGRLCQPRAVSAQSGTPSAVRIPLKLRASGALCPSFEFSSAPSYCECILCLYSKRLEAVPCKSASWKVNSFLYVKVIAISP